MFLPRKFDKYTNYNGYICDKRMNAHEVEEARLLKAIIKMQEKYKDPYIRFMWVTDATEPMCVLYEDLSNNGRKTKLVPFSEVERVIMED
jgi:hypothetical protein